MRRVAGGLALLLVLSGCVSQGAPTTTSTTAAPTTTSSAPPTSTTAAPPETTTTLAVTAYGDSLHIAAVPFTSPVTGELVSAVSSPRLIFFSLAVSDVNAALQQFVSDRVAAYGPQGLPPGYALDFEVLWAGEVLEPLLTIVFTETTPRADGGEPVIARPVLLFDLMTQEQLTAAAMLTPDGAQAWRAMVRERVAEVLGERFCCLAPNVLVADVGVAPEGLMAYLDETDGVPHDIGPLEFLFPWSEVVPLIDMRRPYLASFAVAEGFCSTSGQEWILEDQPGLPGAVAAKRAAIFAAAVACDYAALEDLAGKGAGFTGPLPNGVHPGTAEAFRDGEAGGQGTLWWLVQTLNLDYVEREYSNGDGTFWRGLMWPSAEGLPWTEIPTSQQEELQAIYGPIDEHGYGYVEGTFSGFHLSIAADGTWTWLGLNIC